MIADISNTAQKCTTLGVLKALISCEVLRRLDSVIKAITTNCNPVKAAPDEPTIT